MNFETPFSSLSTNGPLPLNRLDPAHKLMAAFLAVAAISFLHTLPAAALAVAIPLGLVLLGNLPWGLFIKRMLPVNAFFAFLWLMLPISSKAAPQDILFHIGPAAFTFSGLKLAALITVKGNAMAAILLVLAGTSTVSHNAKALLRLKTPEKLVVLLLMTYNNLSGLARESRKLMWAAKLRGFNPKTNLATYKTYAYLVGRLLIRSLDKAERVSLAMKLKGFNGRFPVLENISADGRLKYFGLALIAVSSIMAVVLQFLDKKVF